MSKGRGFVAEGIEVIDIDVVQRRPYTMVMLEAEYEGENFQSFGFSKVCWPDEWNEKTGIRIAKKMAFNDICGQVCESLDM